ncbi:hypothetical protein C0992_005404 [Termitomyces sp. T32_za158]|nr:hypothetical protein C0992_005404 [Termitomyces sp. T32_za158]
MGGAALQGAAAAEPEAAEEPAVPAVEAVAAEELADESAAQDNEEADNEDKAPVTPKKVPTVGGSGPSPAVVKRASKLTTLSKLRLQKVVPQYKLPTATKFTDAQLCNLLVPHQDEVVLDANRWVGENVPGLKGKKTVSLTAQRDFKLQKSSYPTGAQPCYRCNALKRTCTFSARKFCKHGKVDPHVQRNFEKAVLVQHTWVFVVAQWKLATTGGMTSLSAASLVLPTTQEPGIAVDMAVSEPTTSKGKAKAVVTPQKQQASPSGNKQPAK